MSLQINVDKKSDTGQIRDTIDGKDTEFTMKMLKNLILCTMFLGIGILPSPADSGELGADDGARVQAVKLLDTSGMASGLHRLKFDAGSRNTGEAIWVPILVAKGTAPGPRLLLTSAVHGDELNGISVIHKLMQSLDLTMLRGTVIAVPGVNQPGLNANNRHFVGSDHGGNMADLNRLFPGRLDYGSTAERYVGRLWHQIFKNNADFAVDLHTQTRGSDYPLFVFADFRNPVSRQMAFDLSPDLIKNDSGQGGTLETTLMQAGIPSVTLEVGGPKRWQPDLVSRSVSGLLKVMRGLDMLPDMPLDEEGSGVADPFVGATTVNVYTDVGGFAYVHVALMERVTKGQKIATMVDAYGGELAHYYSPRDGVILSVATDPLREPGAMLVRILH